MIGIQARSTSTRLPGKIFEKIGEREMLQHVLDAAAGAEKYLNRSSDHYLVKTVLLIPVNDPIKKKYENICEIFEGSENDVLSRYYGAAKQSHYDYIIRITSDCPLLPSYLISKCLNVAIKNGAHYCSNVDETCRTDPDGWDVEVLSMEALEWLNRHAVKPHDREHVTTLLRSNRPSDLKSLHVIGHLDLSGLKYSVDTQEDLDFVRRHHEKITHKIYTAKQLSGNRSVHRI